METDEEIITEHTEDDLPADSGDDIYENVHLIDIASTSKAKKRPAADTIKEIRKEREKLLVNTKMQSDKTNRQLKV